MQERERLRVFERVVTPHVGAAYNLARWLTRNDQDAEDVVQEASLRAFRAIDGFLGGDSRAWVLAIVRNTSYNWLRRYRRNDDAVPMDEILLDIPSDAPGPETLTLRGVEREAIVKGLESLPLEYREVVVLREMEDLSYREIAEVADLPIGTVMSRLARARKRLQVILSDMERSDNVELKREL